MTGQRLLHYVSLDGAGGVELQFVEFLHAAARLSTDTHAVVACGQRVHPLVRQRLLDAQVPVTFEKYLGGIKLPKWPSSVRAVRQRRLVDAHAPDAVLVWNRLRDSLNTLKAAGSRRCVYWERGASWFAGESAAKRRFVGQVQAILCNSLAAQRMLQLRWGYTGQIKVVPNALRPSLIPHEPAPRTLPSDRPIRLGLVARLRPIKGVALALHALAELRRRGYHVILEIAGDGPERTALAALTERLGLKESVIFRGLLADMGAFYRGIDLLVHPALREPFGQIAVEANAYGIPAVVAAVDGLVEVIRDGETGVCVSPTRSLTEYAELGGSDQDLPPFVYDPARDTIAEPKIIDPGGLADVIASLLDDPARYRRMSQAAVRAVAERFDFDVHVQRALDATSAFVATGQLNGAPAERSSGDSDG